MFYTYILYSEKLDKYYIGSTNDIERRLKEHNRKKGKYTDTCIPWILVWKKDFEMVQDARKEEFRIKRKKSRKYIEDLISGKK